MRLRRKATAPACPPVRVEVVAFGPDDVVIVRVDRDEIGQGQADLIVEHFLARGVKAIVIPRSMMLVGVQRAGVEGDDWNADRCTVDSTRPSWPPNGDRPDDDGKP